MIYVVGGPIHPEMWMTKMATILAATCIPAVGGPAGRVPSPCGSWNVVESCNVTHFSRPGESLKMKKALGGDANTAHWL